MKFDVAILGNGIVFAEAKKVSFLVAIAMCIGFARKGKEDVTFTLSTHKEDEEQ